MAYIGLEEVEKIVDYYINLYCNARIFPEETFDSIVDDIYSYLINSKYLKDFKLETYTKLYGNATLPELHEVLRQIQNVIAKTDKDTIKRIIVAKLKAQNKLILKYAEIADMYDRLKAFLAYNQNSK